MQSRSPKIGAVCCLDGADIQSLAWDFAYELRQFAKTDRDVCRRKASLEAINQHAAAGDDPEALAAFVAGAGLEAIQAYCAPFMTFSQAPCGDYGFWPDLEGLQDAIQSQDGVAQVRAGNPWPALWTTAGQRIQFVMEVNDHGNVTLFNRRRHEVWSCV